MANTDSFIDEVTEEVRRDRLFGLLRRYGWIAVVAVLALVGAAAWNEWRKAEALAAAQATGDAVLAALAAPDAADRAAGLEAIAAPTPEARAVIRLLAASEAAAAATPEARASAVAALRAVGEDAALEPLWRDLALLRAVSVGWDEMAPAERGALLDTLAAPGRPYAVLAREKLALHALDEGRRDDALAILAALAADSDAPAGLRRRAGQVMLVLGAPPSAD